MFKITPYIFIITFLFLSCQDSDVLGCTDESACNYNQEATNDNNTCFYPEDWEDNCGMCDLVPSNDCTQDCLGEWGGDAIVDDCGVCDGNNEDQDCSGECFGDAIIDDCGVCGGDGEDADADGICDDIDDCVGEYDCSGECNGDAEYDECGACNGENSFCGGTWEASMTDIPGNYQITIDWALTFTATEVTWDTGITLSMDTDLDGEADAEGEAACSSAGTWADDGTILTLTLALTSVDNDGDADDYFGELIEQVLAQYILLLCPTDVIELEYVLEGDTLTVGDIEFTRE